MPEQPKSLRLDKLKLIRVLLLLVAKLLLMRLKASHAARGTHHGSPARA